MTLFSRSYIGLFLLIYLVSSCKSEGTGIESCNKDEITAAHLCDATEAYDLFSNNDNVFFLQISKSEVFEGEHIPDAINLWRPDFRSKSESKVKGMRCSKEELENLFSKIGVDSSSQLIIYDTKGSVDAFRFTWVLDYYEYRNHKVLNGGLVTWKKHGYPTNSDTSTKEIIPTDFRLEAQKEADILASAEEVLHAIDDGNTIIVDTREEYEYLGQPFISSDKIHMYKKGAFAAGAIPTAIHFNWSNLSDLSDDQRIKCKKDLLHDLSNNGITPDKNIIVYCQSGSRSSHTAFVLRNILNYPSVRNYDGSWIEWTYLNQTDNKFGIEQHTSAEEIDEILSKIELKTKKENG